ncbi:MAG: hypothetical protein Tsb0034_14450 [Ekhidna sp.]
MAAYSLSAQRIVVDSTSSSKYLIKKESDSQAQQQTATIADAELSFGDRALSIGKGILNRLKARLNLDGAAESLKSKKEQILGREEEDNSSDGGG